jgi:RNA recognition motif-containing protein
LINAITDRDAGRPRGFAFVEMETEQAASAANTALNGQKVDGRELAVNEAKPRAPRSGGVEMADETEATALAGGHDRPVDMQSIVLQRDFT